MHEALHPGEALREDVLPEMKLSVTALVKHPGRRGGQLSTILDGRAAITADLA